MMAAGLAACLVAGVWYFWPYVQGDMEYERVRDAAAQPVEEIAPTEDGTDPNMERWFDWDALRATNPDCIGWIWCPNTPIDYPIVQDPPSDPGKYLHTTFEGSVAWPNNEGTIYLDCGNIEHGFSSMAPLLYGHQQLNNSMFSAFSKNYALATLNSHNQVYIYTPEGAVHIELFAAQPVNANTYRIRVDFTETDDLNTWLDEQLASCTAVAYDPGDIEQLWTFCTCSYHLWRNQRTLTYGRTVESTIPVRIEGLTEEDAADGIDS